MGLTVVTHTAGDRPELLARSVASVERFLPEGARHKIIQTSNFYQARVDALSLDDVVVFVDDDDVVINDSLNLCYQQMIANPVGLVFTDEVEITLSRHVISSARKANLTYHHLTVHPTIAHHLAMFRPEFVWEAPHILKRHGKGICWAIKSEAGLRGGAIHMPMFGYEWTKHGSNMSSDFNPMSPPETYVDGIQKELARINTRGRELIQVAPIAEKSYQIVQQS